MLERQLETALRVARGKDLVRRRRIEEVEARARAALEVEDRADREAVAGFLAAALARRLGNLRGRERMARGDGEREGPGARTALHSRASPRRRVPRRAGCARRGRVRGRAGPEPARGLRASQVVAPNTATSPAAAPARTGRCAWREERAP